MSILSLPSSLDDLELAWLKESYAEGYGKTGKVIAQRNYVKNPSVEVGATSVVGILAGSTVSRDTVEKYSGTASIKVVTDGTVAFQGVTFIISPVKAGNHRGRCRVKMPVGVTYVVYTRFITGGVSTDSQSATITGDNTWQDVSSAVASNPKDTNGVSWIGVRVNTATPATFWVDNAVLSSGTDIPEYFDGDTADNNVFTYEWEGAANNSSSIKWSKEPVIAENLVGSTSLGAQAGLPNQVFESIDNNSFKLTKISAIGDVGIGLYLSGPLSVRFAVPSSGTIHAEIEVECSQSNKNIDLQFNYFDAAGASISTVPILVKKSISNVGVVLSVDVVPPANAVTFRAVIYIRSLDINAYAIVRNLYLGKAVSAWFPPTQDVFLDSAWASSYVLYDTNARSISYLEKKYWEKTSGLTPVNLFSLADHRLAALRAWWATVNLPTIIRKNYLLDPSIENAASIGTIYTAVGPALVQDAVNAVFGSYSLRGGSNTAIGVYSQFKSVNISAGTAGTYTLSLYGAVSANHVNPLQSISFVFKDGGGTIVHSGAFGPTFNTVMNRYSLSINVPSDFASIEISGSPGGEPSFNTEYTYYDGFMLEKVATLEPYFDGSLPGYFWEGDAYTSPSIEPGPSDDTIYSGNDLWVKYLIANSGLPANSSLSDHELAFYKSQLGL